MVCFENKFENTILQHNRKLFAWSNSYRKNPFTALNCGLNNSHWLIKSIHNSHWLSSCARLFDWLARFALNQSFDGLHVTVAMAIDVIVLGAVAREIHPQHTGPCVRLRENS